ncbi:2-C-methyl-D-erythritol 4-phosphate cytidylyltransferase [Clostridium sp. 'deep sea']|uniref:2-C-methyl-D-erythritol 4-phosphate cytidylyltransferase n=1 Tax=Clostridium sp. 'deep sea' TaxID=2779445 RepID=UPI0024346651|nr:2-C-methyl-D-erythritol 4-phosphate cytidylyltransferase [Clostridium sp. 'deep sea']
MNVSSIILAAGKGTRMNTSSNKILLTLGGHSLLSYSVNIFNKAEKINEIIIVHALNEKKHLIESLKEINFVKPVKYVLGGKSRQESVQNGIKAVDNSCEYIAIHDGARPFISVDFLNDILIKAIETGAVIPALPVKDTIKMVENNKVIGTLERKKLYAVQTPQIFKLKTFLIHQNKQIAVTDDASLIEGNYPVTIFPGSYYNKKITTPEDLLFAEAVIRKVEHLKW